MSDRFDCGVAVIGGGPAGIAAAIAAAGCGAEVLLIERDTVAGGNVSQALVHTICGLYLPSSTRNPVWAHRGLPRTFAEALHAAGGAGAVDWSGQAGFLAIDPAGFADHAARALGRVQRWMDATPTAIRLGDDGCELAVERGGARFANVRARFVIDASGDANAAALAGVRTERADNAHLQHASFLFRLDGVDPAAADPMERARTSMAVARAARQGRIPATASSVVLRSALREGSLQVTLNLPKTDGAAFDPLDPAALAGVHAVARADAEAIVAFLVAERGPFAAARVGAWPSRVGIRETRRIRGLTRLEESDVLEGRRRDDEVCVSTWPVELWHHHERLTFRAVAGASSVPLGSLVADHPSRRMAMAGRCVSASHEALGALRVIGTAMATGEAAGAAAALAVEASSNLAAVDPAAVRRAVAAGRTVAA